MVERYRETSVYSKEQLFWGFFGVVVLLIWLSVEINTYLSKGKISFLGIGYIIFFFGIIVWRYGFRYTYILTDSKFIVRSQGLGIARNYDVDLNRTESYSNKYVKKFFKRTKISRYLYRYSSGDNRPVRMFIFNDNRGKLNAILFKASDQFIEELKKIMPDKFLDMQEK